MKLTILGNNGPYPDKNGATSGYLLQTEDKTYLLDVGSGVFANLVKYIAPENLTAIIISHLHFDHISDLGVLSYYFSVNGIYKKVKLYLPDTNPYIEQIISSGVFEVLFYGEGNLPNQSEIVATKVCHLVTTYALTFYAEKIFTYTGDSNFCPQTENLFSVSDVLVCDACFLDEEWSEKKPHMSVGKICSLAQKNGKKVILSHLNPKTDINKYKAQAFGDYILALNGKEILI